MKSKLTRHPFKRAGAALVIIALNLQGLAPAFATVSQVPSLYTAPPDPNVMFTLDDSGSMKADAIPDFDDNDPNLSFAANSASSYLQSLTGLKYPNMWGSEAGNPASFTGTTTSFLSLNLFKLSNAAARYMRSSAGNPLYYDRTVTYNPWPLASNDKTFMPVANPLLVNIHPDDPTNTTRRLNITARINVTGNATTAEDDTKNYWPATYFVYKGPAALPNATIVSTNNTAANFDKIRIKPFIDGSTTVAATYARAATRTDCTGAVGASGCTYNQEIQNFANWLQYYRSRLLMAKGGVAAAFAKQGTALRTGLGALNTSGTLIRGMAQFSGTNRSAFYTSLYAISSGPNTSSGVHTTPLRKAMDDVGKYFQRSNAGNPWAQDPTSTSIGTELTCRRSFHILSTDGFWNGTGATSPANGNNDNFSGNTPAKVDGTTYAFSDTNTSDTDALISRFPINPFRDTRSDTLADVAAYYWKTDLRTGSTGLANNVPSSARDPAFWQHLTTFTVGLGVNGTGTVTKASGGVADLTTQTARDTLVANRTALNWTAPADNNAATGDDLIHASMVGRGRYFSATNPTELGNGLASALSEVADIPLDLAAVAADSPQVAAGGVIYQATFSPQNWYGRLYAFPQTSSGSVNTDPASAAWEASNRMPADTARNIFTLDTSVASPVGIPFLWASLNTTQKGHLGNDSTLLDYVRGSAAREVVNGGSFRDRTRNKIGAVTGGALGDIVNGAPIKGPDAGGSYDRLPLTAESTTYTTFRSGTTLDAMRDTIFVGSNDGMVHAFNTNDGVERFAYVPNAIFNVPRSVGSTAEQKLRMVADIAYPHRFLVDGPPNVSDAYLGGQWKTILAGSLGAGARAVYAMDVTNPVVGASGFGTTKIMWEFSETNNADMGFVVGHPHIVRMRSGQWAVIFGNGYDSLNGKAKLFIVNAANGALIRELEVNGGLSNGLSTPNFVLNANREVETVYAGDLKGNLWKFDVNDTVAANWKVAFSNTALFSAGATQPISVMPEITEHPSGGAMVSFGTGKLFEVEDTAQTSNVNLNTQAIYSIWDKPAQTTGITTGTSALQLRVAPSTPAVAGPTTATGEYQSVSTTNPSNSSAIDYTVKRGWYMNLSTGGERVNLNPQQFKNVLFVVSNTPNTADPCSLGGLARVLALDATTGIAPTFPVFDVNGDGAFSSADAGNIVINRKGVLTQPIFQLPTLTGLTITPTSTVSPLSIFDRGQAAGGRSGGVELARSFGGNLSGLAAGANPCAAVMSSGRSEASVSSMLVNGCAATPPITPPVIPPAPKRISWKQLL